MKMNPLKLLLLSLFATLGVITGFAGANDADAAANMYRLYNPNSSEHFYTANPTERTNLQQAGWHDEGIGWVAPDNGAPVYRLYNQNAGDHHYTLNASERDMLVQAGWHDEGLAWYSAPETGLPLYRLYNPNTSAGAHHYTLNAGERDQLISLGWHDEGISWFAEAGAPPTQPQPEPQPEPQPPVVGRRVYVAPQSGKRYHFSATCRGLTNANGIVEMSEQEAISQGYTLCGYEDRLH